jgi:PAS domain S-box-containing protein
MFIYNREGIYLDYHASDKSLLAVPPEQFLGKSVRDIFPVTLAEQFLQCFDRAIETKQTQVMEYALDVPKGPSHFEARITPMDDQRLLVIVRDITERREAELRLKESEERYRSIFENVQEGIYRTTPEGKIIMANQAMAKMYGYDSPQGIMAAITDVTRQLYVHPEEREKMKGIIETHGSVRNYEVHQYRRNGSTFWLSLTMQAVRDETGRILCYDGISEDITDRKESFEKLRKALGATVHAIAVVVETRDPYTAGHQRRVADLARAIATEMGLTTDQIDGVRMAGVIHDLGKISVPAEILSKPTKLTNLEFRLIKTHAQSGYDILKNIEFPWPIARMVLEHHERMDGSGYPNGLTGDKLLIESRILAVADVVEAMASFRPYRPAVGLDEALDEITKNKGNLYDPEVVDVCLRLFHEKGYKIID